MSARARPRLALVPEDEGLLLQRVAEGDRASLGRLFDRFHGDVYAVLVRLRGTKIEVEDLLQEAFMALPRAAKNYQPGASARAFVLGVAVQHARRERRNLVRRWRLWQARSHEVAPPSALADPEQRASERQSLEAFETALRGLSHAHREVITLVEFEGLKGEEVARILGVPVNTVWTRLHHARAALRASVGEGAGR